MRCKALGAPYNYTLLGFERVSCPHGANCDHFIRILRDKDAFEKLSFYLFVYTVALSIFLLYFIFASSKI